LTTAFAALREFADGSEGVLPLSSGRALSSIKNLSGRLQRIEATLSLAQYDGGHEKIPTGGHRNSPLADMSSPH
jgi:hypothetical protein